MAVSPSPPTIVARASPSLTVSSLRITPETAVGVAVSASIWALIAASPSRNPAALARAMTAVIAAVASAMSVLPISA